jgi:hypothetical protein
LCFKLKTSPQTQLQLWMFTSSHLNSNSFSHWKWKEGKSEMLYKASIVRISEVSMDNYAKGKRLEIPLISIDMKTINHILAIYFSNV